MLEAPLLRVTIDIDGSAIHDWDSFHDAFADAFGFPDFYGRNMDAWIDCMSSLDLDDGLTRVVVPRGGLLTVRLLEAAAFRAGAPEAFEALLECAAFVNWRHIEAGREAPILALAFCL